MDNTDQDLQRLRQWIDAHAGLGNYTLTPVSGDASFRRYFRVREGDTRFILMDAPPSHEDCRPFVQVTRLLAASGLHVPRVVQADLDSGILLLEDLGDELYLEHLSTDSAGRLYGDALRALERIQRTPADGLPEYDRSRLMTEMELFREWFLGRHLGIGLDKTRNAVLDRTFESLVCVALEQPQVCVHRDYHSRNLMVTPENSPGILDYQDAVRGPVTYDLVSLFKDSYIEWPRSRQLEWVEAYRRGITQSGALEETEPARFARWYDLTGVQRQLKVCGIFTRLWHRDGKGGYLRDIPLTWRNLMDAAARYPETRELHHMLITLEIDSRLAAPAR